jgi:small conductance mechanosensitive channel
VTREAVSGFLLGTGLRLLFVWLGALVLVWIAWRLVDRLSLLAEDDDPTTLSEREKRARTMAGILRNAILVGVIGTALMITLTEVGVPIGPLLASAGVVGLAIGFGAQSLVKDLIAGFFILLENQFGVGDVIEAAGVSGKVEAINLRITVLRDVHGKVHFIPNGEIKVVSNLTKGFSRAVVDLGVAYAADPGKVERVLRETAEGLRKDPVFEFRVLEPAEILGLESFGEYSIGYRVILKTLPGKQWDVAREFRKRARAALDQAGIEIPYPHRVIVQRSEERNHPSS